VIFLKNYLHNSKKSSNFAPNFETTIKIIEQL